MQNAHYRDAIVNKKAKVFLLVHETSGGMSAFAARRLRTLGRAASASDMDFTDYSKSYTARSFVSYYGQRMSNAIVMHGADVILRGVARMQRAHMCSVQ